MYRLEDAEKEIAFLKERNTVLSQALHDVIQVTRFILREKKEEGHRIEEQIEKIARWLEPIEGEI
jgi:hypothetical protein